MSDESSPQPESQKFDDDINYWGIWFKGMLASNVAGLVCLAIINYILTGGNFRQFLRAEGTSSVIIASTFLALPFAMGFGASFFWKAANMTPRGRFSWTFFNLLISIVGSYVVLHEGVICLLMAFLLLWCVMWAGCEMGDVFWRHNSFLGATVLPLLALIILYDASQPHFFSSQAQTTMHSDLPPSKLWPYVASYPRNDAPPEWWLWRIGAPYPLQVTGDARVGGRRDCLFSGGVSVGEKVVKVDEGRMIEFEIDKQPNHPEVVNHFEVTRARMELLPDGHGGTIMRGTGWYNLQVYPTWYFAPWCDAALHHVHERVFLHMERLARQKDSH
ncbi:SRPBCC family protein [bacterium]|nr:MAG: SRPBCC family protein [bacterium]